MQNLYNCAKTYIIVPIAVYVALTSVGATAALTATLKLYALWGREPPETLTAAIVNTAAIFAATSFIGVLDMFMTLWTLLRSADWEKEARKEREEARKEREIEREALHKRWEAQCQEERAFQQQVIGQLTAQQERSDLMMTRILELVEQISNRSNGNGSHPATSNPEP